MKELIKSLLRRSPALEQLARRAHHRFVNRIHFPSAHKSYSQQGEDLLIACIMKWLHIAKPTYLDIGAHHPFFLSNTYSFYRRGCRGVCIEPDPYLHSRLARARPRDMHLNVGVGVNGSLSADFYVMDVTGLNTFSKEEADRYVQAGRRIDHVIQVRLVGVNDLIRENFKPWPNLVSLDIEGLDLAVLKSVDFKSLRPEVFCVETIAHTSLRKDGEIIDLMRANDYEVFADTYTNTIFVEGSRWREILAR